MYQFVNRNFACRTSKRQRGYFEERDNAHGSNRCLSDEDAAGPQTAPWCEEAGTSEKVHKFHYPVLFKEDFPDVQRIYIRSQNLHINNFRPDTTFLSIFHFITFSLCRVLECGGWVRRWNGGMERKRRQMRWKSKRKKFGKKDNLKLKKLPNIFLYSRGKKGGKADAFRAEKPPWKFHLTINKKVLICDRMNFWIPHIIFFPLQANWGRWMLDKKNSFTPGKYIMPWNTIYKRFRQTQRIQTETAIAPSFPGVSTDREISDRLELNKTSFHRGKRESRDRWSRWRSTLCPRPRDRYLGKSADYGRTEINRLSWKEIPFNLIPHLVYN